jgi:hypothetical protein
MNLQEYGHDMPPYTPSKIREVPANGTEEIEFQGPSRAAFGVTRVILSASAARGLKVTFQTASGDTTHWKDVLAPAIQRYFEGYTLRVPVLIPRAEKSIVTLENLNGSSQTVGVQLEGLHDKALKKRQKKLDLSPEHSELSFFYGTSTVASGNRNDDLAVNYERRRKRAFDRFAVGADASLPHVIQARLIEKNAPIRRAATLDQISRAFEDGRRAPTPYVTEPFGSFAVEATNQDGSDHEVSFFAASFPPSMIE